MADRKPVAAAWRAFDAALQARTAAKDDATAIQENRRAYLALSAVCRAYVKQVAANPAKPPAEAFPPDVAQILHAMLESLAAGNLDQSIRDLIFRPGAPGRHFGERQAIEHACRYIQAAKDGLIADRAPVATIARWFGVARRTAQGWARAEQRDLVAGFLDNASPDVRAEAIADNARKRGTVHQQHGRSQAGIARRARSVPGK